MEKEKVEIGTCMFKVPEYEDGCAEIAYVKHLDGGVFGGSMLKNFAEITVDKFTCEGFYDDMPGNVCIYDVEVDSSYYFRVMDAWHKYREAFDIVSHKMQDFSYGLWAHKPGCDIEWKGDVKVGDTFMGISGSLYITKITREVGRRWDVIKKLHHYDDEKEAPFGADRIGERHVELDTHMYRSFLIHPIPEEIWDEAYAAYMEYKKVWDDVVGEIREKHGLPVWRKRVFEGEIPVKPGRKRVRNKRL